MPLCHSRAGGNPDLNTERLDPRSPRAGATPVDGIRGNDGGEREPVLALDAGNDKPMHFVIQRV